VHRGDPAVERPLPLVVFDREADPAALRAGAHADDVGMQVTGAVERDAGTDKNFAGKCSRYVIARICKYSKEIDRNDVGRVVRSPDLA
jgi:hypothetical protein